LTGRGREGETTRRERADFHDSTLLSLFSPSSIRLEPLHQPTETLPPTVDLLERMLLNSPLELSNSSPSPSTSTNRSSSPTFPTTTTSHLPTTTSKPNLIDSRSSSSLAVSNQPSSSPTPLDQEGLQIQSTRRTSRTSGSATDGSSRSGETDWREI